MVVSQSETIESHVVVSHTVESHTIVESFVEGATTSLEDFEPQEAKVKPRAAIKNNCFI